MMKKRDLKADLEWIEHIKEELWNSSYAEKKKLEHLVIEESFIGWPHAIERALEAEKRVEELENQVDILSTTLNMYCSPYYDMRERADKAESLARELVEALGIAVGWASHSQATSLGGTKVSFRETSSSRIAEKVLAKYKEVFGDV